MPERHDAMLLPAIARAAIARTLGLPADKGSLPDALTENGASFVTLHLGGRLRGCIGTLMPVRPLAEDVQANAVAAAFRDFRFPPLAMEEFGDIDISVSVLGAAEWMPVHSEADAIDQLVPGADGLILDYRGHRGTFLPQVWQQLPDAGEFLTHLKCKAGLPPDFWHADIRLSRYRVEEYEESKHDHG
jgi:AmmeMemoRadiSam system protein A